jgi:SAM-dependent methyltransferase
MTEYLNLETKDKKFNNCVLIKQLPSKITDTYLKDILSKLFYEFRTKIGPDDFKTIINSPNDIYASWSLFNKYNNLSIDFKENKIVHKPFTSQEIKENVNYRINRGFGRAKKIMRTIDLLRFKYNKTRALDYGCGDGYTGANLFNMMGIKHRYSMDVYDQDIKTFPTQYIKHNTSNTPDNKTIIETLKSNINSLDSEFKQAFSSGISIGLANGNSSGINIVTENSTPLFDVIFVNMVFHHIKDVNKTIQELDSLLNKDGILIFREHNCDVKDPEYPFINFEHVLYTIREKEYETNSSYILADQITYPKCISDWIALFPKYKVINVEKEKDKFSYRKPNNTKFSYDDPFTVILQKL